MSEHKALPIVWAVFSLLLLFNLNPSPAESTAKPGDVDTLFTCTWSAGPVTPVGLLDSPVVTVGGNLYIFGGVQGGAISAASFKFDGTTWTPIAALPAAVEFPAAVTDGTNCYIMGGALTGTGTPQTTLWRYDVATNTYTTLAPFTVGTWNHSAVYLSGKIYKWCGTGPSTASAQALEIYDVVSNTWSGGPAYPLSISFVNGWTDGTYIYGAGGIQSVGSVASAKTYRLDPANLGAGWVDGAIADLPATRWGAATAVYTDAVLAGGYVAGVATANISNSAIAYDVPSDTWQTLPVMAGGERARFTGSVLNGSFYAIGGRSIESFAFGGTNSNQKLLCLNVPTNIISNGGSMIISAGGNGVLDPGETVAVALGAQNFGGPGVVCTTAATTGTLQATGGVTNPSAPQNYGALCSPPNPTFRNFTFTVDPQVACGANVTAILQVQDGATNYGTLTYTFVTGTSIVALSQNWDSVVAPALPPGWTSSATGIEVPWVTSMTTPFSAPNEAFAPDPSNVGDTQLVSPTFAVPAGGATLSFKNSFNTEPTWDREVLEISINGGAFDDIIAAGGTFLAGGYNTGPISTAFGSPITGRGAWTGNSGGYINTIVILPLAANGQMVQLRWRMTSDNSVSGVGVRIDDISIANQVCEAAGPLVSAASRLTHGAAGTFDVNLPIIPTGTTGGAGIECRRGGGASQDAYTIVANFSNTTLPGGISNLTIDCGAVDSVAQGVNANQLLFHVSGLCYNATAAPQYSSFNFTVSGQPATITWGHLLGDTNASTGVNSGDSVQTRGRSGQPVDGTNFRSDVNTDGSLNSGDTTFVRARSGHALP